MKKLNKNNFNDHFNKNLDLEGGAYGTYSAEEYSGKVKDAIDKCFQVLQDEACRRAKVSDDYLKGYMAEQWHAKTFDIDAVAKGIENISASVPGNNIPGNDIVYGDNRNPRTAEVKYYKTGEESAKAISRPDYIGKDKIVPEDQLMDVKDVARKLEIKNSLTRPEQSKNYKDTADNASDKIEYGDVSSKPLSESDAKKITKASRDENSFDKEKINLTTEEFIKWSDILRESGEAALHAAILSAAIEITPKIFSLIKDYATSQNIDWNDTFNIEQLLANSGNAALRAGVAACIVSATGSGLLGKAIQRISPKVIGISTVLAFNSTLRAINLVQGKISNKEFIDQTLRDAFVFSFALLGTNVGQFIIPIPILGALIGNMIGATIGRMVSNKTNELLLGLSIEKGWTFFGLIDQDYKIAEHVLQQAGYDLIDFDKIRYEELYHYELEYAELSYDTLEYDTIEVVILRRGVIGFKKIGNIYR